MGAAVSSKPLGAEKIVATPFKFTQGTATLHGHPISFANRPWLPFVYDVEVTKYGTSNRKWRKSLLIYGRQCEKSSSIGYKLIAHSALTPFFRCLYVNPSTIQLREFSDERLKMPFGESRFLQQFLTYPGGQRIPQNVNTKWLANNSKIMLRACFLSPDRIRGVRTDLLAVDEFQDILPDNMPVIEETMFHCELADGPIAINAGTPKGFDTPLQVYWDKMSTQGEWMFQCSRCNKWNTAERECVGPDGLLCLRCRGPVDPVADKSQWVFHGPMTAPYMGFRLPQPVVIYAYRDRPHLFQQKWQDLQNKIKVYSPARLMNEVFALPYEGGTKPVTREQIRACCNPNFLGPEDPNTIRQVRGAPLKWAGIDWGSGSTSTTALSFLYYHGTKLRWAWWKRYEGFEAEPEYVARDICQKLTHVGITRSGNDYGFGFGMNSQVRKAIPGRVLEFMYIGKQAQPVNFDGVKFTAYRTAVMTWLFDLIRRRQIELPAWEVVQRSLLADISCIALEESSRQQQLIYSHPVGTMDDLFHTGVFGLLASFWDVPRPDLTAPDTVEKNWSPLALT